MISYSQNFEDRFILNHFGNYKGTLLEIGANDGKTLSNSLLLIENGWFAHLIEPGAVYSQLKQLHRGNANVETHFIGIGEATEVVDFYESGAHVLGGVDKGLVSSAKDTETIRWRNNGVDFKESKIQMVSFGDFLNDITIKGLPNTFDFISIDAEGMDWDILQQINLNDVGCRALCIEFNGDNELFARFSIYCGSYGLKLAHSNAENLIFLK